MPDDRREPVAPGEDQNETAIQLTPELIEAVADRVWQLWKRDLQIEGERYRPARHQPLRQGGP